MQQRKIVEDYLDSVIPQKISESTRARLRAEVECHIYDRAEFYMEIGYDEDSAFAKAIEQMGEGEEVKTDFESLYSDSTVKGWIWFFGLCAINWITISPWGYWHFVEPNMYASPSIVILYVYLAAWVFLIVHIVNCFRQKLHKQLTGITAAFGLIALGSIITNGILFPVLNAGRLIIRYITDGAEAENDMSIAFVTVLLMGIGSVLCLTKLASEDKLRKKPYRISLKQIALFLLFVSMCFVVLYGFAYEKYEWRDGVYFEETLEDEYISNITAEHKNAYDTIRIGDNINDTENLLKENGYEKYGYSFEAFLNEHLLPYDKEEFLKKCLPNSGENYCATYRKILCLCEEEEDELDESESDDNDDSDDGFDFGYGLFNYEHYDYGDVVSFILVFYDDSGKINQRMYLPDVTIVQNYSYLNYNHGKEAEKWFVDLQKGDNCETALEFMRSNGSYIIECESHCERGTISIYNIYLDCYYPLDTDFIDFLFGEFPEFVDYRFVYEITAENGTITDFKEIDWYN